MMAMASQLYPFTHIIITAPSAAAISCYEEQMHNLTCVGEAQILVVADPDGVRIGSGGGTLNALARLDELIGRTALAAAKVLIVHSGGDSRRSPLHSVCGKAWASINTKPTQTPMQLLVKEIADFCGTGLLLGAMVAASSDVLLDVTRGDECPIASDAVTVAAVPEIPDVAKNHGILVPTLAPASVGSESQLHCSSRSRVSPCERYLQKPSVQQMREANALVAPAGQAWVDTGLVAVTGTAFSALLELLDDEIVGLCTERRMRQHSRGSAAGVRLELYSDILLALSTASGPCTLAAYYQRLGLALPTDSEQEMMPYPVLRNVWQKLRNLNLHVALVPTGTFCHLGTSAELLDMLSSPCRSITDPTDKIGVFCRKYNLVQKTGGDDSGGGDNGSDDNGSGDSEIQIPGILLNSIVSSSASVFAVDVHKHHRLAEHSVLNASWAGINQGVKARITDNTIISHCGTCLAENMCLEPGIMLQQVYLRHQSSMHVCEYSQFAVIVLGIRDDVKRVMQTGAAASATGTSKGNADDSAVCGLSWKQILKATSMSADDLWPTGVERSLWTAPLFAVAEERFVAGSATNMCLQLVPSGNIAIERPSLVNLASAEVHLVLTWLQNLRHFVTFDTSNASTSNSAEVPAEMNSAIVRWKQAKRLSLADLLRVGDPLQMHRWRTLLSTVTALNDQTSVLNVLPIVHWAHRSFMGSQLVVRVIREVGKEGKQWIASTLLAMWCARTCLAPAQADAAHAVAVTLGLQACLLECGVRRKVENSGLLLLLQDPFEIFWKRCIDASAPKLVLNWLHREAGPRSNHLSTTLEVLAAAPFVPTVMQPRMFFFLAWLVGTGRDINLEKRVKQQNSQSSPSSESDSVWKQASAMVDHLPITTAQGRNQPLWRALGLHFVAHVQRSLKLAFESMSYLKDDLLIEEMCNTLEKMAQKLVSFHVQSSLDVMLSPMDRADSFASLTNKFIIAKAPARIDLMGGWSDTPPVCYETAGSVLNVGVTIDGTTPLICCARAISTPILILHNLSRHTRTGVIEGSAISVREWSDLTDVSSPEAAGSLLKACLLAMQVVTPNPSISLQKQLMSRYGGGIEIGGISTLPTGSGMGGSSILAAAVVTALGALLGRSQHEAELVYCVSLVEQLLTTGGGWQDQAGCLPGGFKINRSIGSLPLEVSVNIVDLPMRFIRLFEQRSFLVYTGVPRLARNILINALRSFSLIPLSPGTTGGTIGSLIKEAEASTAALQAYAVARREDGKEGDEAADEAALHELAKNLSRYWHLKTLMAAGSEPLHIAKLLASLRPYCCGLSICGAGAGGYAICILHKNAFNGQNLMEGLTSLMHEIDPLLSVHSLGIDLNGVSSKECENDPDMNLAELLKKKLI